MKQHVIRENSVNSFKGRLDKFMDRKDWWT